MLAPATSGDWIAGKDLIEPEDGVESLGFVGGVDGNHAEGKFGVKIEEVSHELDEELVLARLAGEDDDEGVAVLVEDGILQAGDGSGLIGTQVDAGSVTDEGRHAGEEGT